jgi:mycothiol system anti-sigma-R factor
MTEFDCQETKQHVHEYLQQELSEREMDDIAAHLANCDSCEADYDYESLFNEVIQRSCQEEPPQVLADRILDKIRKTLDQGHPASENGVGGDRAHH